MEMVRDGNRQGLCAAEPAASRAPQLWGETRAQRRGSGARAGTDSQREARRSGEGAARSGRPGWRQGGQRGRACRARRGGRHSPSSWPWRRDTRGALWRTSGVNRAWSRTGTPTSAGPALPVTDRTLPPPRSP